MTRTLFPRFSLVALLLVAVGALSACDDTIRGFGQDVEDTGEGIEEAVD
ncbi:MAG: entericidin A/B family lipoprotein [Rhodospirillaceae bacterium]|nr:entericidin A/B family lipoprotein [Rhodospirillaceae bacterium]